MKKFFRGDIFWCDLGKSNNEELGSEQSGIRPVVVVQNNIGNRYSPTVIVVAITSQIDKIKYPTQVILKPNAQNGLKRQSAIIAEQIRTRDKRFFGGYIGKLSQEEMIKLNEVLGVSVGLKNLDEISKKINSILNTDMLLKFGIERDHINNAFFQDVIAGRERQIKDLEIYCKNRNLDYRDFYNPYEINMNMQNNLNKNIKNRVIVC